MKINIKLKDFLDKVTLQKNLDTRLKKPVQFLAKQAGTPLPFCYEAEYFEDGSGFMSIGVAKELTAHFKKQRTKGQGKDESGKLVKIDKKKVAYGQVTLNEEGVYEFLVEGGMMKKPQVKATIKSVGFLKKNIGDKFAILTKAVEETAEELPQEEAEPTATTDGTTNETAETAENTTVENTADTTKEDTTSAKKRALRDKKRDKIAANMDSLSGALGRAPAEKVKASIAKYQSVLADVKAEANADGEVDAEEQAQIDGLEQQLSDLQAHLDRIGDGKIKMTPKNRAAVQNTLEEAKAYLAKVKAELANAV